MSRFWLFGLSVLTLLLGPVPSALAEDCCEEGEKAPPAEEEGKRKTTEETVHGGVLVSEGDFRFETTVREDRVCVYVYDSKGRPRAVKGLGGKVVLPGQEKKVREVSLEPVAPEKGRTQGYLEARTKLNLDSEEERTLAIRLTGLVDEESDEVGYEVPLKATPAVAYICPMHADQRSEDPGDCGKCGMKLGRQVVKKPAETDTEKPAAYTCPMHPEVKSKVPGRCPECGMKLKPARAKGDEKPQGGCGGCG